MAAAQDVFEEHLGVIAALKDNYTRQDDAAHVGNIASMRDELAALCAAREEQVKSAIKELTRRVAQAEVAAAYPHPEGAHEQRVSALTGATSGAYEGVERLTGELREVEEKRRRLKLRVAEVHQRASEVDRMVAEAEPRSRHNLSLYAHVSRLTWRFDSPGRVAGEVSVPESGDIRHFDYDAAVAADYDTVNRLWEMMDPRETSATAARGSL